jgi:hypothetical protein
VALTFIGIQTTSAQIGGSARGYQAIFVPSTALASPGYDGQPAVYLYIAGLEMNVLNCRGQGRAPLARRDLAHAAWAVASRELCRSRTDSNGKHVAESNLSLCLPAHIAVQGAIVSGCVHG